MSNGATSLARPRRQASRLFTERVFVGRAIDIGSGPDPLTTDGFPRLHSVREWDMKDGDATFLAGLNEQFDVCYSSHCLEHIPDPQAAVRRWWSLVKVGGHLMLVVPDEELYERGEWPPARNTDHKHAYTTMVAFSQPTIGHALRMQNIANECRGGRVISLVRLEEGFIPDGPRDQTATDDCECGIELVIRKEREAQS